MVAAVRTLKSAWVGPGPSVRALEDDFCDFLDLPRGNVIAVSSGTAALYLALWSLNVEGKRVSLPAYGCASLSNAIDFAGGIPVYLDSASESPNVDYKSVDLSRADVHIAVSTFGIPVEFPVESEATFVEDISQALGSQLGEERVGIRGTIGIASLAATKILTTGGAGGILFSRDSNKINLIRDFLEFDSKNNADFYRFNFNLTDLQAGIGRVQLKRFAKFQKKRDAIFAIYRNLGLPLLEVNSGIGVVKFRAVVETNNPKRLISSLRAKQIMAIEPYTLEEIQDGGRGLPNVERWATTLVSLPIYPGLSRRKARLIARHVKAANTPFKEREK